MRASVFLAIAALGLGACASTPVAERTQIAGPDRCVTVSAADLPETKVCPKKTRLSGTFFTTSPDARCLLSLDVRADGTVSSVKVKGARPSSAESNCLRSAYRWTFDITRNGEAVSIDSLQAGVFLGKQRNIELGPDLDTFRGKITFDTRAIERNR